MIALRPPYVPEIVERTVRQFFPAIGSSKLARTLARKFGGNGDWQLRRLMRISADDGDERQLQALRCLLRSMP